MAQRWVQKYLFSPKSFKQEKKESIARVKNERGIWQEDKRTTGTIVTTYFRSLFDPHQWSPRTLTWARISDEMNLDLTRFYIQEVILTALKQMHPSKSLGPNSMPALFFQKYYYVVGNTEMNIVLKTLNDGIDPSFFFSDKNHIVLVPKVKNLENPSQNRPFSLCNVVFKLISKTITNRLNKYPAGHY